jgi:hypothetical protein
MSPEIPEWMLQLVGAIATALLTLTATVRAMRPNSEKSGVTKLRGTFWLILSLGIIALISETWAAVAHHNYYSELLPRYEERFRELRDNRIKAATAIYGYLQLRNWDAVADSDTDGLDDILDFFDDMGFDWIHGQISSTLLHQYFYYYVRMYCQETGSYITLARADDPTVWENISPLFDELTRIEAKKLHAASGACRWNQPSLEDSLKAEIRLEPSPGVQRNRSRR